MRIGYKAVMALLLFPCTTPIGQTPATKSVLGTVSSFNMDAKTLDVRPDNGAPVPVKLLGNTLVQRIAPGQTSLANAATIQPSDIATGDRVLVTVQRWIGAISRYHPFPVKMLVIIEQVVVVTDIKRVLDDRLDVGLAAQPAVKRRDLVCFD